MPAPSIDRPARHLRVRLAADAISVPGARRFIADGLADWGLSQLVDDAALCVSEMAANAALHSGSRFMDVHVRRMDGGVEIAVEDQGAVAPIAAIAPRVVAEGSASWIHERTTGRGLAIVSMLARDWGVTDVDGRRRIWAELTPDQEVQPIRPPRLDPEPGTDVPESLPPGWKLVVVPQAPVELSMRIDNQIDEVVRELQLIDSRPSSPSAELAALIQKLLEAPYARQTAVERAAELAEGGAEFVDVQLPLPREAAAKIRGLLVALRKADELCRSHEMLSVPATPEMDLLREWFTHTMVAQLEDDAEPVLYDDWLAHRDA